MYIPYKTAIETIINNDLTDIKTVDWFNNQYSRYENLKARALPAIYIEFNNPLKWEDLGNKSQMSDTVISLHLVIKDLKDSPDELLTLASDVFKAFHGKSLFDGAEKISTGLSRSGSDIKDEYDQLKVMIIDFKSTLFDRTAVPVTTGNPVTPNISTTNT